MAKKMMINGNQAASYVAHATNEVIAIYPITPSSEMGEWADQFSAEGRKNIWGTIPDVVEMQSEAGAAGAVHGALTTGALTTTFTASQGLLLMIPNMFKIAGELTPAVFHISARAVAAQALSIFGDHSDVMAARSTGWALLSANSVQEISDFALIAQASTLEARVPFLHFFDGFRSSSEIQKVEEVTFDQMREMIDDDLVAQHRKRALNPDWPTIKGTSQNPDVFFAARETVNPFYDAVPGIVQKAMDKFATVAGRQYRLFDYVGAPDAEQVVIMMGSGAETMDEVVSYLAGKGAKVGLMKVRLYRPFSLKHFLDALPSTVQRIAVLDRTKEPGSLGEPLYQDIRTAIGEAMGDGLLKRADYPLIVGGRHGLGSNEFNPGMAKSVFDNLDAESPQNHFTVGIRDDVGNTSLEWDDSFSTEGEGVHRAMFFGLGSDGTVSANKDSIKIIGDSTDNYAQGYFSYDSKKSGSYTISHLRFGEQPIKSTYLIQNASFVACHMFNFLEKLDMLGMAEPGGVFLLNTRFDSKEVWEHLPVEVQQQITSKKLQFYVIDANTLAEEVGLAGRINRIMMTAFFKISGVLPPDQAIELIKTANKKTYGKRGQDIVDMNNRAVDSTLERLQQVDYAQGSGGDARMIPPVAADSPEFVRNVLGEIIARRGDKLPVSMLPNDGTYPTGTTQYEKRNIAEYTPVWDPDTCIQCGECSFVCPHAVIRLKYYDPAILDKAPATFKSADGRGKEFKGMKATIQVSPEDCTGCGMCVETCPAYKKVDGEKTDRKAINMAPQPPLREQEAKNFEFFLTIPEVDSALIKRTTIKGSQLLRPLFEFSGACAGCGETPYVKLMTQLFGDRAIIGNATGCSSIYGGNLPTTPYTTRSDGRGPTWSNSLFEDAAEFAMGMRLTADKMEAHALEMIAGLQSNGSGVDKELLSEISTADQSTPEGIEEQRSRVARLDTALDALGTPEAARLRAISNFLVTKSIWGFGGDGWAYDIGYGGVDHVVASGRNVNLLVLDTEVYSNTGGQMSKATPIGAIAKFAAGGKPMKKKDLGIMAMSYGSVYVARIAMGYNKRQTLTAFLEAEAYDGPSLIIAYSHCISHQINMTLGLEQQKMAVESGAWVLCRYNPDLAAEGKNPLILDSKEPTLDIEEYMYKERRFRSLRQMNPQRAEELLGIARRQAKDNYAYYKYLSERPGVSVE